MPLSEKELTFLAVSAGMAHGVPPALVLAVILKESSGRPSAIGDSGASFGLMQVQIPTARGMGFSGDAVALLAPDTNTYYGTQYLAEKLELYNGDRLKALSAYNAGHAIRSNLSTYAWPVLKNSIAISKRWAGELPGGKLAFGWMLGVAAGLYYWRRLGLRT